MAERLVEVFARWDREDADPATPRSDVPLSDIVATIRAQREGSGDG